MNNEPFRYRFVMHGGGGVGAQHCTHCPEPLGAACKVSCAQNYERVKAERAAEGVIVNDEP